MVDFVPHQRVGEAVWSMGNRVELFAQIRRDARVDGLGVRVLARKYRIGRDVVWQALTLPESPPRKMPVCRAPKLERWKPVIDGMLRQDLDAPRKQVQTATRIWNRLLDEHDADISYAAVRDYVCRRRPEIETAAGKRRLEAFVPHASGGGGGRGRAGVRQDWRGDDEVLFVRVPALPLRKAVHRVYSTVA